MIRIVGDINFTDGFFDTGFGIGSKIKSGWDPFKNFFRNKDDIWFGNLECVVSNATNKKGIYAKQFRISPEHLDHLHHFDIYNIANNHTMQHGSDAFLEMLKYLDSKSIKKIGSSNFKTITISHQAKEIGIMSFSQRDEKFSKNPLYWYKPEYSEIEEEYQQIRNTQYTIAYIHWGNEFINRPYNDQKKFAHWLADLGFDLIIGLHPHILQGFEVYNGKYIFYSLGNFVFNMPEISTTFSCIVNLDLGKEKPSITYDYVKKSEDFSPELININEVPFQYTFDHLNTLLSQERENELYYQEVHKEINRYRKANFKYILKSIPKYRKKDLIEILMDFGKRRILKK